MGLEYISIVESVIEVPLVKTLLRSVLVVSTGLELLVTADRKLDRSSSLPNSSCHKRGGIGGTSSLV